MPKKIEKFLINYKFFQDKKNKHFGGKIKALIGLLIVGLIIVVGTYYFHRHNVEVLNPKGPIALKEEHLIFFALLISLIVVVPVFIMTFSFGWRYRESNRKAKYSPESDHNVFAELLWWGIPTAIIAILSVVAWNSSHQLDPYKPLVSKVPAMTIQVVSLDWKWLFIYPEQNIASVNEVHFPINTPIRFELTSDAPMNSFWIPQLSGQIYVMPGMETQLNLLASSDGTYRGLSANISGRGFAGMSFNTIVTNKSSFDNWATSLKHSESLNQNTYNQLARPSEYNTVSYYNQVDPSLFNSIIVGFSGMSMTGMN